MREDKSGKRVTYEDKDYTHLPLGQVLSEMKDANTRRETAAVKKAENAQVRQS